MAKILIIEDEDLVARMYEEALKFDGYEVACAIGGKEGLQKVLTEKPDLVLLDIMMPEPNGILVLEEIRKNPELSSLPVIMLTNLSGDHDKELARVKGANDYWVKKDINLKQMGKKIEEILSSSNSELEEG